MPKQHHIYLIAGEPSGDFLGAALMRALKIKTDGNIRFSGIGGPLMAAEGLNSLFPMAEIALMGLVEIIPHILHIRKRIKQTVNDIFKDVPDAVVTIDSPGFCKRVIKKVRRKMGYHKFPLIHYVAPSVWAWRPGRAKTMAKIYDHLLTLFPFENQYFVQHGLMSTFVGHPVIDSGADAGDRERFVKKHKLYDNNPVICLLPGSRKGELSRHLPLLGEMLQYLERIYPHACFVIPTVPHVEGLLRTFLKAFKHNYIIITDQQEKYDAFAASDVALAASGTVTLELAVAKVPTVVFYRMNPITYWIARKLVKIPYASLINILSGHRMIVPEFLQGNADPHRITRELGKLIDSTDLRKDQITKAQQALIQLGLNQYSPADKAAETVLKLIQDEDFFNLSREAITEVPKMPPTMNNETSTGIL